MHMHTACTPHLCIHMRMHMHMYMHMSIHIHMPHAQDALRQHFKSYPYP